MDWGTVLAYAGIAVAVIFGGFGSAVGVGLGGQVSAGVVAEDPDKFGRTLVLTALPGTQGIYGFVIGLLILFTKIGPAGGTIPFGAGLQLFLAGLPVGIVGLVSGIWQGKVSAAGIGLVAKRPDQASKGMLYAGMVETYAILAFLISFLLMTNVKV